MLDRFDLFASKVIQISRGWKGDKIEWFVGVCLGGRILFDSFASEERAEEIAGDMRHGLAEKLRAEFGKPTQESSDGT